MDISVNVKQKKFDTTAIRNQFIQGEALADIVTFLLPLEYGDVDLAGLNYSIRATSEDSETTATQVLSKTTGESSVKLEWTVSGVFTSVPGKLRLILVGSDEAGDVILKCAGDPVYVRSDPSAAGFASASPDAYEELLAQINYRIAHQQVVRILGTYETLEALTAAVTDPLIGDMYNVGSAAPYTVYVWTGEWTSLGALQGPQGEAGAAGADGTDGVSVPAGGSKGSYLRKASAADYDFTWGVPDFAENLIINGKFDYWRRATSQTTFGYGSSDRWAHYHIGNVVKTVSREAFAPGQMDVPENPKYFCRTTFSGAAGAGDACYMEQHVEDVALLSGKTITLSLWAKSDVTHSVQIEVWQYFDGSDMAISAYEIFTAGTSWDKITKTMTLPSVAGKTIGENSFTIIRFVFATGTELIQNGTFDIANVQLNPGSEALPCVPRPLSIEAMLCKRYAISVRYGSYNRGLVGYCEGGTDVWILVPIGIEMRTKPAITIIDGDISDFRINPGSIGIESITVYTMFDNHLMLRVTTASTVTAGDGCSLRFIGATPVTLLFDAEL